MYILLLLFVFCMTSVWTFDNQKIKEQLEQNHTLINFTLNTLRHHPYRDVNIQKNESHWEYKEYVVPMGNSANYQVEDMLGEGGFAKVFQGVHIPTGDPVALKFCLTPRSDIGFHREILILEELKNAPNFLPIRDIYTDESFHYPGALVVVFDLFEKPRYFSMFNKLTKIQIKHFLYQTLKTLDYAHSRGIIHRDLKPPNILMNPETLEIKLIDWGLAEFYHPDRKLSTAIGTMAFTAPELLLGLKYYDYSSDIWSVGTIFAEMMFQKLFFFGKETHEEEHRFLMQSDWVTAKREKLNVIAKVVGTFEIVEYFHRFKDLMAKDIMSYVGHFERVPFETFITEKNEHLVDAEGIDLLEKMLTIDHTDRITAAVAMEHPYFDEVRNSIEKKGISGI